MSTEHTLEVINRYLNLEKRTLQRLINGEIEGANAKTKMLMKSGMEWKIKLLEDLKEEIIGE